MANNRTLSDAIQKMIDNIDKATKEVALEVSKRMVKDLNDKAEQVIDDFYSYKHGSYTRNGREYQLYSIYKVNDPNVKKNKNGYTAQGILTFDESKLKHYSNTGLDEFNGVVQSDYVFNELFLKGQHPWFSGAPYNDGSYDLIQQDAPPAGREFESFVKNYDSLYLDAYVPEIVEKAIKTYL